LVSGLCVSVPALITYWLYRKRRDYCHILERVKAYSIGDELNNALKLSADGCLPYASISGFVKADTSPIQLSTGERTSFGVIHSMKVTEHKSEWNSKSSSWDDSQKVINHSQYTVPFSLESENKQSRVSVEYPLLASGLSYSTVCSKFEPAVSTLSENLFSMASGTKIKGYESKDDMLLEGTQLTALGKIESYFGKVRVGPPDGPLKYILSTDSLKRIINSETTVAKILRGFSVFFAVCSGILLSVWLFRHLKKWHSARQQRAEFERLRSDVSDTNGNECVVCLEKPRDVVILNCGHICSCKDCSTMLTQCPICRGHITRIVPTFVST